MKNFLAHIGNTRTIYWLNLFAYTQLMLLSLSIFFQTIDRILLLKRPYTYNNKSRKKLFKILIFFYIILATIIYFNFLSSFSNKNCKKIF